jgi:AcrR family transcriptional regulator
MLNPCDTMREPARNPLRTKEAILIATETLIAQKGIPSLTLDEIARAANVSKGGLLHHFPSKTALIHGLAERMVEIYDREVAERQANDPLSPGAYTRALIQANLAFDQNSCQVCSEMSSESRNFPSVLEVFREHWQRCLKKVEADGLDPIVASTVHYAVKGLLSAQVWGMSRPAHYEQVVEHLMELAGARAKRAKAKKN